ncbi:hypothetical protein N5V81_24575 [Escherichia coli]|nr:hypothetical protein [Escherichia coli]
MLAIIATTLQTEPESLFHLIYGNRTSPEHDVSPGTGRPERQISSAFTVVVHFSQETLDSDLLHGRIDGEKLQSLGASLINFRLYDEHLFVVRRR